MGRTARGAAALLLAGLALAQAGKAGETGAAALADSLRACRGIVGASARLACYDALTPGGPEHAFRGAGSAELPQFAIPGPRLLRFTSDDAVMVLYLLNASGEVVKNLHRAGAGEGAFLIETPGEYSLQVNATGGWTIRIETP